MVDRHDLLVHATASEPHTSDGSGGGQLGNGSDVSALGPSPVKTPRTARHSVPVAVSRSLTFTSIGTGTETTCAVAGSGWCWGRNLSATWDQ